MSSRDSARDEILTRVQHALADVPADDHTPIPRDYDRGVPGAERVALFADRVAEYQATVRRCGPAELPSVIATCLRERGIDRVVTPADLPDEWSRELDGTEILHDDPALPVADLDHADGVVTGCAVAIAVTGTVVLDGGDAQGRRALTLVPDYHLCVVRADQIADSVPHALDRLDPHRPLTFISGPSATSDIELDRVEGVHGPRALDILVEDPPATSQSA